MSRSTHSLLFSLNNEAASSFLKCVFLGLDQRKISYCVERNYENYPDKITGDVDIIVNGTELKRTIQATNEIAESEGWAPFVIYQTHLAAHIGYYSPCFPSRFVLVIEYFNGGSWRGIRFLDSQRAILMREKYGITWKPHASHEALNTLIHHLLYNATVFGKYRERIYKLYMEYPESFFNELSHSFRKKTSRKIAFLVENKDWTGLENLSSSLRNEIILFALKKPFSTLMSIYKIKKEVKTKPIGLLIQMNGDTKNQTLAKEIIFIANSWHLLVPPERRIVDWKADKTKQQFLSIKKTLVSGGFAIVLNGPTSIVDDIKSELTYLHPIVLIQAQEIEPIVTIDASSYPLKQGNDFDNALLFWNLVLNKLSSI